MEVPIFFFSLSSCNFFLGDEISCGNAWQHEEAKIIAFEPEHRKGDPWELLRVGEITQKRGFNQEIP